MFIVLLDLVVLIAGLMIVYLVVTQIIVPLYKGRTLFPMFRTNALRAEVAATREEVGNLQEQNELLDELAAATKQRQELKQSINEHQQ
jgi:hypothetical protein